MKNLKMRGANFYLQGQSQKKQREISLDTKSYNVAKKRRDRFLATLKSSGSWDNAARELRGGTAFKKGGSPTCEEICELYEAFNKDKSNQNPVRGNTVEKNVGALRLLMDQLKVKTIRELERKDIVWGDDEQKALISNRIRNCKGMFKKTALGYYARNSVEIDNPLTSKNVGRIEVTPYKPLPKSMRVGILEGIETLPPHQALVVILGMKLGLRRSEIDSVRLSSIQENRDGGWNFCVKPEIDFIPKTKNSIREIPIAKSLVDEILGYRLKCNPLGIDDYLIPTINKSSLRLDTVYREVCKWLRLKGIGEKRCIHILRKEFASFLVSNHDLAVCHKLCGHTSIDLTMKVYGGLRNTPVIEFA